MLLGAGATILGNVKVGPGSLVGACSLVLEDIGANSVAVGVPAKVVGQTTDQVGGWILFGWCIFSCGIRVCVCGIGGRGEKGGWEAICNVWGWTQFGCSFPPSI